MRVSEKVLVFVLSDDFCTPTRHEAQRLATLEGLEILDIEPQERFDGVTSLAKRLLDAGYVAISLIGQSRQ
ncbi:MAG: hypothetical protein L7V86_04275 [Verrucomicrobiales bacterium]|nr:hypothetical protein [Verrucomicrobiales bacterium]MDB4789407.1 hypothetical protein [Verrucomicrobiales bacterium]